MLNDSKIISKKKLNVKNNIKTNDLNSIVIDFSKNFKVKNLMDLKGKISFYPDYDYKKLRKDF